MADTGRTVWSDGFWSADFWAAGLWAADEAVEVPDVVGETQAAGTLELETALFVVSVETAYSPSVAVGLIVSQDPVGGSFAASGSTVEITVSLGPEPVTDEEPSGGWLFLHTWESELRRRREEAKKRAELEEETEQIQDALDRNIAQLLREQEAIDAKRAELKRLGDLARQHADLEAARRYSERVAQAFEAALESESTKALARLEKELRKAREEEEEEEEELLISMMLLLQ